MAERDILAEVMSILDGNDGERDGERKRPCRDSRTLQRREWDAEHLRTVCTRLPVETVKELDRACYEVGTSRYAVLKKLILDLMGRYKRVRDLVEKREH